MALLGRRVYLALSSCSSVTGHRLLSHQCRGYPEGAVILQVGHVPQVKLDKGSGGPLVGSLQNVPGAPGMGESQGESPCMALMGSGHYPPSRSKPGLAQAGEITCASHRDAPNRLMSCA